MSLAGSGCSASLVERRAGSLALGRFSLRTHLRLELDPDPAGDFAYDDHLAPEAVDARVAQVSRMCAHLQILVRCANCKLRGSLGRINEVREDR